VPSKGKVKGITCFSDTPVRQSWLYQHQQDISDRPFLEAVYAHAYNNFSAYLKLFLLANLIWDERVKDEALRQKCLEYFNTNALPLELQTFLFDPNAPFAKLRFQINIQDFMPGQELIQCLRPHYAVANMPFPAGRGAADLVNGDFAMKLYGAHFTNQNNEDGTSHFPYELPLGFLLKKVHIHEGTTKTDGVVHHFWVASPNNCQIANTDKHNISQSFYSVVMGKCMQYCATYSDTRPWDGDVTAIVTLHIVLEDGSGYSDADIIKRNSTKSLPETAKKCYDAWEDRHQHDIAKTKNPFKEFYDLLKKVDDDVAHPADRTPRRPPPRPIVTIRPTVTPT
jgi:hypothetical protein